MMTSYKQFYTVLCLFIGTLGYPALAQPISGQKLPAKVEYLTEILSKRISLSTSYWEDKKTYYLTAQLSHRFNTAISAGDLTTPPQNNAYYYWGQFPDTTFWQQKQKETMRKAMVGAKIQQEVLRSLSSGPEVVFVRKNGSGNGSSWSNAYGDLQEALSKVQPGQEIWVANGVYFPTQVADRQASFVLPDSVRLYGGFKGYETARHERDWEKNLTILSGEIGGDSRDDNSYSVVYTSQVGFSTLLDGFVITGGFADGVQSLGDPRRCGGGWYNDGADGISNPTVSNCLFVHNYARDGAAFYNYTSAGQANPIFIDCQFVNNQADLDGGGLFIDSRDGSAEIQLEHCLFADNRANFGAAISNRSERGTSILRINRSAFESNVAYVRKVIHNGTDLNAGTEVNFILSTRASRFADNISVVGEDENTSNRRGDEKKLGRGEISFLDF